MTHEVVITGMGAVTPCGIGCDALWENLSAGRSGIVRLSQLPAGEWGVDYGGEVLDFDPKAYLTRHCPSPRDRCTQMGLVAGVEALGQAGLLDDDQKINCDVDIATILGTGAGPNVEIESTIKTFYEQGPRAMRPTSIPKCMFSAPSSMLSIYFGLRGANHVTTSACASGMSALGHAYVLLQSGVEDVVLTGATESTFTPATFTAWSNMRVLARHDEPTQACRPFDKDRNGLVLGEGSALIVLETREHAERRGAKVLGTVIGYGAASDAVHITAPQQEGQMRAMRRCLADAGLEPEKVGYVNAHGTSTKANDEIEANAIVEIFGARGREMPVTSTKSMLGHSLGATGAIEFVATALALENQFVPPTINCENPDPDIGLDYVPGEGRPHSMEVAMSNSFAFGGNNSVVLIRRETR